MQTETSSFLASEHKQTLIVTVYMYCLFFCYTTIVNLTALNVGVAARLTALAHCCFFFPI